MNIKKTIIGTSVALSLLLTATPALAHVVVGPNEAGVAQRVNFVVGVPTEEDVPTIGLRLLIPEGLESVRPNVKPGWNIEIIKSGEGEDAKVTEIIWTGGEIPADQRDEFVFRAMTPAEEAELQWKAYQTYEGGKVVSWDADPKVVEEYEKNNSVQPGQHDDSAPLPYSVTKVTNDLKAPEGTAQAGGVETKAATDTNLPTMLSIAAIVMAAGSLFLQTRKKR